MSQTIRDLETAHAPSTELSATDRHRLLESARRRHVLEVLDGRAEPMALADLAAAIVEREPGVESSDDVATDLHHTHLPKLADAGVLEYDPSANQVIV